MFNRNEEELPAIQIPVTRRVAYFKSNSKKGVTYKVLRAGTAQVSLDNLIDGSMEDKKYNILAIYPAEGATHCERCGKAISWVARVQTDEGIIRIGVDCAEILQAKNIAFAKKNIATANLVKRWAKGSRSIKVIYRNAYEKSVDKKCVQIETTKGLRRYAMLNFVIKYCPDILPKL